MTPKEAKEKVLAVWPDAMYCISEVGGCYISCGPGTGKELVYLPDVEDADAAWIAAASKEVEPRRNCAPCLGDPADTGFSEFHECENDCQSVEPAPQDETEQERVCAGCETWIYWDNGDVTYHCGCNAGWKWKPVESPPPVEAKEKAALLLKASLRLAEDEPGVSRELICNAIDVINGCDPIGEAEPKPTPSTPELKMVKIVRPTAQECFDKAIELIHKLRPVGCFGDEEGNYSGLEFYVYALKPQPDSSSIPDGPDAKELMRFINHLCGGSAQGMLAYGKWAKEQSDGR